MVAKDWKELADKINGAFRVRCCGLGAMLRQYHQNVKKIS
jgi:hypothetical protein